MLALLLAGCGASGSSGAGSNSPSARDRYGPASDYLNLTPTIATDQRHPYIKGKLVVVWSKRSQTAGALPGTPKVGIPGAGPPGTIVTDWDFLGPRAPALHPAAPAQIGTVATLYCQPQAAGRMYTNGMSAWDAVCTVTIVDLAAKRLVGHKVFVFRAPDMIRCPMGQRCPADAGIGWFEMRPVATYLAGLPRRP